MCKIVYNLRGFAIERKQRKEILNAKDVAAYLDLHLFTVHKYAREGKIPAFKIGADWRFNRKSLDKWIHEKEQHALSKNNKNETLFK